MSPAPRHRAGLRHAGGILLSAALFAVYARVPQAWALGFVALVPWLWALDGGRGLRAALLSGAAMAVAFVAGVLGWFGAAIAAYIDVGAVPATAALLALAPLLQPQLIAYAIARRLVARRHGFALRALASAAVWVACEAVVPKLFGDTLGHGLHGAALLRQGADLGGAAGLTVILLLVNDALACALSRRQRGARAWSPPLLAGAALVAALTGYGAWRLDTLQAAPAPEGPPLRVAMVQASITDYERLRREIGAYGVVRHVLDTHYALSWSALRDHQADVLLWSETVYPTTFGQPRSEDGALLDAEIRAFVDTTGVPLVFGSYDRDAAGEYNAATFVEPGRGLIGAYRKTHPFPFTEHVPRWLDGPRLRAWLPWTGSWQPGHGARVMPLRSRDGREVDVVPLICLDDVHPQLAIDGARLGAQAILGMSNDSWFTAHPLGARLHLTVAAFRSIETRLPQVRVTTNGLSAVIDDTGAVQAQTSMGDQAVLTAFVHAQAPLPTLMVRWGDWVGRAALGLWLAWAGVIAIRAASRRLHLRRGAAGAPQVYLLSTWPRGVVIGLRLIAAAGLIWLAFDMLQRTGLQVVALAQLKVFAGMVVLPLLVAGAVLHHSRARMTIDGAHLRLTQRRRRIEVPMTAIAALRPWRWPWPLAGLRLELASGRPWHFALATPHPRAVRDALQAGSVPMREAAGRATALGLYADARGTARRPVLDHPLLKFGLFPLLPALVAFRLHQIIAFGGAFGEWQTFGAGAWFTALGIWWAAWSLGLMLFAAALRVAIEPVCLLGAWRWSSRATGLRERLEQGARWLYYAGVPLWLAWRLLAAG
ncbi:apolipoprotein N-acyltransferase [Luteimonas sp. WGS1318]|uniref:apolipoprotein N-acyltransferase n=1 Tax=Luteimonas sp. WGS1318 TaxID=3366815 RepID=UPI00372CEDCE